MLSCKSSSPALTYCGHCDHEKIDTVPVCKTTHPVLLVIIGKIGRVAAIFKLQTKTKGMKRVCLSGWSMLMLTCLIYIIYIIATKKHTSKIAWSTKCIARTMHFLYHSYCYAVLSGPCCCWCWDNHYLFPRLYRVAWEKGCGCGERWIILLKKKENKKPFLRNKNENQRENLRKQTG